MNTRTIFLIIYAAVVCCFSPACSSDIVADTVAIEGGQVKGIPSEANPDVIVFKGIPYAAPPVGDLRWKNPQPVIPWDGVLVADHYKKICPQVLTRPLSSYPEKYRNLYTEHDEDCLYLNVWTPAEAVGDTKAKLPVMFWIHGGQYKTGSGITMSTDGDAWAKHGVILVTINYRLNVLGFLNHPELTAESGSSGNYGMYDQLAALKWTYENIAQFGGDPENITIAGQSAGGRSVKTLVISPLAKPYIAKAIIESGGGLDDIDSQNGLTQFDFDAIGQRYVEGGGYSSLEELRKATYLEIIDRCSNSYVMSPHIDGTILTESFTEAVNNGNIADIPFLIGYNDGDSEGRKGDIIHNFCVARDQKGTKPAYEYEFIRTPGKSGNCPHSGELVYVFGTLDRNGKPIPQEDYELSEQVVTWWTDFCKGIAPWEPYTEANPYTKIIDVN